jgi:hypothetical protein
MDRERIRDGVADDVTEDGVALMHVLEETGFTPSRLLCVLCAAIAAIAIRQERPELMTMKLDELGAYALSSRVTEVEEESGGENGGIARGQARYKN